MSWPGSANALKLEVDPRLIFFSLNMWSPRGKLEFLTSFQLRSYELYKRESFLLDLISQKNEEKNATTATVETD
ncbi:hypothetical protein AKJ16_DCAP25638 [Drosera capensis]